MVAILLAMSSLAGCGRPSHMKEVAPVSGAVQLDGTPITEGYITFTPDVTSGADPLASGKSASGTIGSSGEFHLSTYGEGDGAIIGSHTATFFRPDPDDDEQIVKDRYIPGGKSVKVEVQAGSNLLNIHLHKKGEAEISRSL